MTGVPGSFGFRRTPVKGRDDSKIVVTIQSPISIPLTLHLDVASRHMKRKKTAHSCKHDSQFASISHGSESLHMKKKTIRRSEDSNTIEEGEFMHEYFKCRTSVPRLR